VLRAAAPDEEVVDPREFEDSVLLEDLAAKPREINAIAAALP
jgi:hypothetical protein